MEHCRNEWNAVGTHGTLGWAMEQAQPGPADNAPPEVPGRNAEAWAEPLGARTLCPGRIRNDEALRSTKIWNARSKPKASAKQGKASARGPRAEGGEGELQRRGREGASMPPPRAAGLESIDVQVHCFLTLLGASSSTRMDRSQHAAWSFRHGGVAPGQARLSSSQSRRARARPASKRVFEGASAHAVGAPSERIATDKGRLPARPRSPFESSIKSRLGLGVVVIFVR